VNCASCGTANESGRRFCRECGGPLLAACPSCGAANAPDAKFCGDCGAGLPGSARASDADGRAVGPGPAGSDRVAERRLVSVLFADLVGFTPFAEKRDAEETRELLTRYFEVAREVIERHAGVVEKFIGDAVMAVWGAPMAREDDAERAVRAALELVDAVRGLGPTIQARAGVLTGEAAVTLGATNQGMVAGDLVNTAARLQSAAEPGTVLVGEATQRASAAAIVFEAMGPATLKGKQAPVAAWRALRVVAERGGRGRSDALEAPFVGRDTELRLLKDLFHAAAREGHPRLVSVTGQGGIGKSRLAWEFLKYVDGLLETVWWHSGRSPAYGEGIAFWALGEMVRSRAGLVETDDEATTRARIAETVAQFVPDETEGRWIETALLTLLGVGELGPGGSEQLFAAWRTFFERIALGGPVVLVFEDLHWADPGLLGFIEHLLEWAREAPIFVATLARPELLERRPDWGAGRRGLVSIALEPLPDEAMRELLAGLVPGLPEGALATIVRRADGIPLYAVETVRMLVAEGRLVAEEGRYRPAGDLSALAIPETLQALIAARLDALSPADRALLQDAAVLGQSFTLAGLGAVSGIGETELEPRLRALTRRELLSQEVDPRSPERGQFAFVQALIREVAYNTLARADRKTRHLAAARFLESLETDELAGGLAAHYLAAHDNAPAGPESDALAAQARVALRAAADRAVALGAQEQALAHLRRAIEIAVDPAEEADLLERAGRSAIASFERDEAISLLERAVELQRRRGDRSGVVRALTALGRTQVEGLRSELAIPTLEAADAEFADLGEAEDLALLRVELSRAYFMHGEAARAIVAAEAVLPTMEKLGRVPAIAELLITKGSAMATVGRLREGTAVLRGGLVVAQEHGLAASELRARINLSAIAAFDDPRTGLAVGRDGLELANRLGIRGRAASLLGNIIGLAMAAGEWNWAIRTHDEAAAREPDPLLRAAMFGVISRPGIHRGTIGEPEVAEFEAMMAGETDPNLRANVADVRAGLDHSEGRFLEAYTSWRAQADEDPFSAAGSLWDAADAALWMRDPERAGEAVAILESVGQHGRYIDTIVLGLGAGVAALEGRRAEAIAGFRAADAALRDLGVTFDQARIGLLAAITLGPDEPAIHDLVEHARAILIDLDAVRLLERFDAVLAERPAKAFRGSATEPATEARTADAVPQSEASR